MKFVEVTCKSCGKDFKIRWDELQKSNCPHCNVFGNVKVNKIDYSENDNHKEKKK